MEPTSMGTVRREGTPKLREPRDMKDRLEKCSGEESEASKCVKVMETLAYQRPGRRKTSPPTRSLLQKSVEWKVGGARLPCLLARSPPTVLARAVLGLGSWEAKKWVWAAGAGSQLTAADYLMERFLHRR